MSAIPLHLQRRFEQRWASRFPVAVVSTATRVLGRSPHHTNNGSGGKTKSAGVKRSAIWSSSG